MASLPIDVASVNYAALLVHQASYDGATTSFPIEDFGFASAAKTSTMPTFWAPLGTAVRAPVTGTVRQVVALESDAVALVFDGGTGAVWKLEHVATPTVKAGDRVNAGQVVGVVGEDAHGLGRVALGLSVAGAHECPFADGYVDLRARAQIFGQLAAARAKIEVLISDQSYFDQPAWETENCISLAPGES